MHDNTQSIAYEGRSEISRGYMRLIKQFQDASAPFIGYLHSGGFCVARTDAMPSSRVSYHQRTNSRWSDRPIREDVTDARLNEMRDAPGIYEIISAKLLPEKQWYCLSKAGVSGIRKAAEKIRRNHGFGNPYLLETVESDGETTAYTRYG